MGTGPNAIIHISYGKISVSSGIHNLIRGWVVTLFFRRCNTRWPWPKLGSCQNSPSSAHASLARASSRSRCLWWSPVILQLMKNLLSSLQSIYIEESIPTASKFPEGSLASSACISIQQSSLVVRFLRLWPSSLRQCFFLNCQPSFMKPKT